MPKDASPLLPFAFAALAGAVAIGFVFADAAAARRLGSDWRKARQIALRTGLGAVVWMSLTGVAAASGALARFDAKPPPLLVLFVGVVALSFVVGLSRVGERLALGLPIAVLVGVQSFRLALELVMHRAAQEGVMPVQMTFSGWNFDIVTGATAIAVATLAWLRLAPRALIIAWNVLGIALLATILVLALISTPAIHAFGQDPRKVNTFVAYFPFVWLPSVLVPAAMIGHIVLTRRLATPFGGAADKRHAPTSKSLVVTGRKTL